MAIYRLGEVCNKIFAGGDMPRKTSKSGFPIFGNGINNSSILGYIKTWTAPRNSITVSARGTIGYVIYHNLEFTPVVRLITLISNKKIVLSKYLFYKLKTSKFHFTGAVQKQLTVPIIKKMKIKLPSLQTQQQIIDIIEPIEKLIFINNKMLQKIEYIIMNLPINKTFQKDIFKSVVTGKLSVTAINENGKYNFYSCSSAVKKTNFHSFNGQYILLSNRGKIYTWWYNRTFDLSHNVYALKEKKSFFTTFLSVKKDIKKLRNRSSGSVIKLIKLSDIKTITMLDDKYEKILEKMFIFEQQIKKMNEKNNEIKNKLIKLLIK